MTRCMRCGAENKSESRFCYSCGSRLLWAARPPDPLGLAGFAFFLVIVGIVVSANPNVFSDAVTWFSRWPTTGPLVRPPEPLIGSAVLFFALSGASSLLIALARIAIQRLWIRAVADAFTAVGLLSFAFLVSVYERHALSGPAALGLEAAVIGTLLFVYIAIVAVWGIRRRLPVPEAQHPPTER